jgi:hypothetical protein
LGASVQDPGDEIVVGDQHQFEVRRQLHRARYWCVARAAAGQAYLGVDPAHPMDGRTISAVSVPISAINSWMPVTRTAPMSCDFPIRRRPRMNPSHHGGDEQMFGAEQQVLLRRQGD